MKRIALTCVVFVITFFLSFALAQPKGEEDLTKFNGVPLQEGFKRCASVAIKDTCPEKVGGDKTYKLSANKRYLERKADGKTYVTCQKPIPGSSDDKPCFKGEKNCSCRLLEMDTKATPKIWKSAGFNAAYFATYEPKKDHEYACICQQNP